jgi:alkylhydroperoxidase/carboxymuconolactone decarboxylase family protein YurZ
MKKKELIPKLMIPIILAVPLPEKFDGKKGFYDTEHIHNTYADYTLDLSTRNLITISVTTSLPFQGTANITLKDK